MKPGLPCIARRFFTLWASGEAPMRRAQTETLLRPRSPLDLWSPSHDSHSQIHPHVHSPKCQGQFLKIRVQKSFRWGFSVLG